MSQLIYYKIETFKNFNSIIQVPKVVEWAVERKMKAIGIADVQAMYSVMDFYTETNKKSIKPIIATQVKVKGKTKKEELYVTMIAKNYTGYLEMVRTINHINTKGEGAKKAIFHQDFEKMEHVIATVSFSDTVEENRTLFMQEMLTSLIKTFKQENVWIELEPAFTKSQKTLQKDVAEFAESKGLNIIAAPTVRYYEKKQKKVIEVLEASRKKKKGMKRENVHSLHLLTEEEENEAFKSYPNAVEKTQELASICHVVFPIKGTEGYERKMPDYKIEEEFDVPENLESYFEAPGDYQLPKDEYKRKAIAYFCTIAWKGFFKYYRHHPKQKDISKELKKQLGLIIASDFNNYFLHVQGIYRFTREAQIPTGPGRGSVAGALVARCVNIIDINPYEYDLLFERFLNLYRSDEPDVDIDISKRYRYRVFEYARQQYGEYNVAKIITFNPYGGKKALEYVAKQYKFPMNIVAEMKEIIDKKEKENDNKEKTIKNLYEEKDYLDKVREKFPQIDEILEIAVEIEVLPESHSIHAAALVLSKHDFRNELPINMENDKQMGVNVPVIQYTEDGKHLESLGFTKIDLLSVRTLDVREDTKNMVKERKGIVVGKMPLDNPKVYELLQRGELIGIFQLDSEVMRNTAKDTKPTTFRDIVNLIALYRPGGKDEIPHYIENKRKNNRIIYDVEGNPIQGVEELEPILYRTYGIIVYQEQIMKIAQTWSGYDLGQADILRRAISKKNEKTMTEERKIFVEKAKQLGRDESISNKIYDLIVKFSNFGFNESHAVAYAQLVYEMMYLKVEYPLEFMSALISSKMEDTVKAAEYIEEAKRMGLKVLPPSISTSREKFVPQGESMLFGLPMIKDVSAKAIDLIVKERSERPFLNFTDFLNRMHSQTVNKKNLKALIEVGTFQEYGNQNQLLHLLDAKTEPMKIPKGQKLFTSALGLSYDLIEKMPELEDISLEEKIENQKRYTCMVLEYNPMNDNRVVYKKLLNRLNKTKKLLGGVIADKRVIITKDKKEEMAFLTIQGTVGVAKVTVFPEQYKKYKEKLKILSFITFSAKKKKDDEFILQDVDTLSEMRIMIQYPQEMAQKEKEVQQEWMKELESVLTKHQGEEELVLTFKTRKKVYKVKISDHLVEDLKSKIKEDTIAVEKVR